MNNKKFTGITHPHAPPGIMPEKRMIWHRLDEPQKVLPYRRNVTAKIIFDVNTSILVPDFVPCDKSHVRRLDFLKTADRFRTYVRHNQRNL